MHPWVNIAKTAARHAGDIIARSLERLDTVKVNEKALNDFVTDVDLRAEQVIIDTIRDAYPEHGILAEESGGSQTEADTVWIVDPLDGTRNFLHGFPQFAVSIGIKHKGRLEHGLIYDPLRYEYFTATRGSGAYLNNTRIRVSKRTHLEQALLGTGFPFRDKTLMASYLPTFENLIGQAGGIRRAGAAALDLAYVAAGRLDGFWELGLKPWDLAAGVVIIKEAGGLVSDLLGEENYLSSGNIIAGNPRIFKALVQKIRPMMA